MKCKGFFNQHVQIRGFHIQILLFNFWPPLSAHALDPVTFRRHPFSSLLRFRSCWFFSPVLPAGPLKAFLFVMPVCKCCAILCLMKPCGCKVKEARCATSLWAKVWGMVVVRTLECLLVTTALEIEAAAKGWDVRHAGERKNRGLKQELSCSLCWMRWPEH